jgi:hypothetical protein
MQKDKTSAKVKGTTVREKIRSWVQHRRTIKVEKKNSFSSERRDKERV